MQLDHVAIPVGDLAEGRRFYEQALAPFGAGFLGEFPGGIVLRGNGASMVALRDMSTEYRAPVHVAFAADRAAVDAFYEAAVAAGGTDNGAPGVRPHYHENYYAAFVRDPWGNNVEAVCHAPSS
jgi:catechol 2,3-dioxygenase-like lactoylglutathione lyase family enzyme